MRLYKFADFIFRLQLCCVFLISQKKRGKGRGEPAGLPRRPQRRKPEQLICGPKDGFCKATPPARGPVGARREARSRDL